MLNIVNWIGTITISQNWRYTTTIIYIGDSSLGWLATHPLPCLPPSTPPAPSPAATHATTAGCSKAQRWNGVGCAPRPSFRDVLLAGVPPAAASHADVAN